MGIPSRIFYQLALVTFIQTNPHPSGPSTPMHHINAFFPFLTFYFENVDVGIWSRRLLAPCELFKSYRGSLGQCLTALWTQGWLWTLGWEWVCGN